MRDIIPHRKRPTLRPPTDLVEPVQPVSPGDQRLEPASELAAKKTKKSRIVWIILATVAVILILAGAGGTWWWDQQLQPVAPGSNQRVRLAVLSGQSPSMIADSLHQKGLIKSQFVFEWYVRFHHIGGKLQAGTYSLSKGASMSSIVSHLTSGKTDVFNLTFLPGATQDENRTVLKKAGYSDDAIYKGLSASYNSPILAGKPISADLEGYIYGETYQFDSDATVEQIIERTLQQFSDVAKDNNLTALYKKRGLTLYQGVTLASVIQREVMTPNDQKQVAQVFYLRLKKDMPLGSDVTYQYAAKKLGITPDPSLDSPYNTRIKKGLPPGPIATPGLTALLAVAQPAKGDYLYFLSGDDDKTYFAHTNAEHEKNIEKHCKIKCLTP